MRSGGQPTLGGTKRPQQQNDSIPRVAPKWLKHDRQVSPPLQSHSPVWTDIPFMKRERVVSHLGFKFYYYMVDPGLHFK